MKKILLLIIMVLPLFVKAQQFTSDLPIIMLYTDINPSTGKPYSIPDEPKVPGRMIVLWHKDGGRTSIADVDSSQYWDYNGPIGIERRGGGTTQNNCNKKNYGIRTGGVEAKENVSLLGLAKEHSWCLQGSVFEPSQIRDVLTYDIARDMGQYAPRCVYCEVFLNDKYVGLYFLTEKIKVDDNRVNIAKLEPEDKDEKSITGGYIVVVDHHHDAKEPYQWSLSGVKFYHEDPDYEEITKEQHQYIADYTKAFNDAVMAHNTSIVNGYPSLIDIPSFVDYVIINELSSNVDGYRYSTFMYKERNGKLYAGPVWDYNCAYGLDFILRTEATRSTPEGWQYCNPLSSGDKPLFWTPLIEDSLFHSMLVRRWNELTQPGQVLDYDSIMKRISHYEDVIAEAVPREIDKWKGEKYYRIKDHYADIDSLKVWIKKRIDWLSSQWTPDTTEYEEPSYPLVISKIHYHPEDKDDYDQDELEFIGITNVSDDTVNLTGCYFPVLGMSYVFPNDSVLPPHREIFLASNAAAFEKTYGFVPFGEYARHLSNSSQRIVLADAYGHVIDEVEYMDKKPWPKKADGDGYYLRLNDLRTDNNVGENWVASDNFNFNGIADDCYAPSDLKADVTEDKALISWTPDEDGQQWEINYKAVSEEEWMVDTTEHPMAELVDLTYNTKYDVRVRCLCSEERISSWAEADFTTLDYECVPPVGLECVEVTHRSAVLKWNQADSTISEWVVSYRPQGSEEWIPQTVTTTKATLEDLKEYTSYEAVVVAHCKFELSSDNSDTVVFTTKQSAISDYDANIRIYPNPTAGTITCDLRGAGAVAQVEVYDVYGRLLQSVNVVNELLTIDASEYAEGMYFVRIVTNEGTVNRTFIKK